MFSIIPGQSVFKSTCTTNWKNVANLLETSFSLPKAEVEARIKCLKPAVEIGKTNPSFMAMAIFFDMNMDRYKSGSVDEATLWEAYRIPTKASICSFLKNYTDTVASLMQQNKGHDIDDLKSQAVLRLWRKLQKSKESLEDRRQAQLDQQYSSSSEDEIEGREIAFQDDTDAEEELYAGVGIVASGKSWTDSSQTEQSGSTRKRTRSGSPDSASDLDND